MTITFTRSELIRQLTSVHGMKQEHAVRAAAIADQHGSDAEATPKGVITITAMHNGKEQYSLDDGLPASAVARRGTAGYNQSSKASPTGKGRAMPRGRAAQTEPAAEENGTVDYTGYADKPITATMVDFHEWLEQEVGVKLDLRSVALGGTLRMEFQRSEFNQQRRAARQAERAEAAAKPAAKPETEKPAAAKPATRGRKPGGTTGRRGAPDPATRGRGRPAAAAAEAPF